MKSILLLPIVCFAFISPSIFAKEEVSQKLPFIGKRNFNFAGGNGTEEYLIIKKNGQYILGMCGMSGCINTAKGKYSNPLKAGEGLKYLIYKNKIYQLQANGEIATDCKGDGQPCEEEFY